MNICITPESIKLFGSYVNRKLGDRLTNDKTAEALLNELFDDALSVFDGNGLSTERNKELILQHMSIVPQIVLKYAGDNPKLSNAKSLDSMRNLAAEVIEASESKNIEVTLFTCFLYRIVLRDLKCYLKTLHQLQ
jgi:hypothetical protein